tara:strand:- start:644 stop:889 length:246 start_codon:yes stop_codon:yes gene_type:complete
MKNKLIIILLCGMITGCVAKESKFDPNATIQGKTTVRSGDALGKRIDAAEKRIKKAVDSGEMTPEQGKEMMNRLNRRSKNR